MLSGLADEQVRWNQMVEEYEKVIKLLPGDIFLASGCVAYFGPFLKDYRSELEDLWIKKSEILTAIPMREQFDFISVLGNPNELRNWQE